MNRTGLAVLFFGAAALIGQAQSPGSPIHGRVVGAETGDPLTHARVVLFDDATPLPAVFSDQEGRFVFPAMPTGRHRLFVTKAGYAANTVFRPDEASAGGIDVRMARSVAISGRVVDGFGEPSVGVNVAVNVRGPANNPKALTVVKTTQTDDLGEYRLGGLSEGSFVVSLNLIQMDAQGDFSRTATYYPGVTTLADAETLSLRAGDQKTGVDFVGIASQATTFTVSTPIVQNPVPRLGGPPLQLPGFDQGTATIPARGTRSAGLPLPHTTVRTTVVQGAGGPRTLFLARSAATDDDGRFELLGLPRGSYRISASKVGYTSVAYGQRSADDRGEPVDLADGEALSRVDIVLPRYSSMTGRIVDEYGDPVEGISVRVAQIRFQAGRRRVVGVDGTVGQTTDDLGRYRVYGLRPGQYVLSAVAGLVAPFQQTPDLPGYATTYFPGTPNPIEAQMVPVSLSQDLVGIDFTLARVPTARIAGRVLTSTGEPLGGSLVLVPSQRSGAIVTPPTGARTYPDGRFEFPNVPPGEYVIQADSGRRGSSVEGEFASQFVTVNGTDVTGLLVQSPSGSTISGHVIFEGDPPPSRSVTILPARADLDRTPLQNGSIAHGDVRPDLTFEVGGIRGPRRLTLEQPPAGWTLKAVLAGGIDVTDVPLPFGSKEQSLSDVAIVLTNRVTELSGVVLDARGNPAENSALVVFSSDRERWYPGSRYLRRSTPDAAAMYRVRGLPPGDYAVAAIARTRTVPGTDGDDSWQDPDFLESLALRATRITLNEGQKLSVNPKLAAR